jgi:TnpA family transposase
VHRLPRRHHHPGRPPRAVGISPEGLAERLVLVIYGYGTARRTYLTLEAAREIAVATVAARRATIWSCTASEVAAMVQGAPRHGTSTSPEGNYVASHGQSEIGFGITRLLGFELLPRSKQINKVKLYRLAAGETECLSCYLHSAMLQAGTARSRRRAQWRP